MKMEREQIIDAVRDWLDQDDWHYDFDAEDMTLTTGVGGLDSKIKKLSLLFLFKEDCYTLYATAPINGDTDDLTELNKFITMANYGLRNGNFELDFRDGEIRYKTFVNCDGLETLPEEIIKDSVYAACLTVDRYGDGLAALAMGFSDAETEIKKVEGRSESDESEDESEE